MSGTIAGLSWPITTFVVSVSAYCVSSRETPPTQLKHFTPESDSLDRGPAPWYGVLISGPNSNRSRMDMSPRTGHFSVKYRLVLVTTVMTAVAAFPGESFAYLDPGAGSFAFQMLIAAGMAALFALKMYWRRIKAYFRGEEDPTAEIDKNPVPDKTHGVSERKPDSAAHSSGPDKEES